MKLSLSSRSPLALLSLTLLAGSGLVARPAQAQKAIKLYNTGVNNDGTVAAIGTVDQHYTQINPAGNPLAYVYADYRYTNPTNSQYIAPDRNGGSGYGGSV